MTWGPQLPPLVRRLRRSASLWRRWLLSDVVECWWWTLQTCLPWCLQWRVSRRRRVRVACRPCLLELISYRIVFSALAGLSAGIITVYRGGVGRAKAGGSCVSSFWWSSCSGGPAISKLLPAFGVSLFCYICVRPCCSCPSVDIEMSATTALCTCQGVQVLLLKRRSFLAFHMYHRVVKTYWTDLCHRLWLSLWCVEGSPVHHPVQMVLAFHMYHIFLFWKHTTLI